MFNDLALGQKIAVVAGIIYCVTLHELAHAWVATWRGDPTPGKHGRLTWNPIVQLDPIYSVAMPIITALMMGFPFGWAYCPIDPSRFKNPLRDRALVAIAGPAVNFAATLVCIGVLWLPYIATPEKNFYGVFLWVAFFNALLGVFNLLPLPGLDGYDVLRPVLPLQLRTSLDNFRKMSFLPILVIFLVGPRILELVWPKVDHLFFYLLPAAS